MLSPEQLQTASDFLQFFEAIPDEKWCVGVHIDSGQRCAAGHLGMTQETRLDSEGDEATRRMRKLLGQNCMTDINDGRDKRYQQPTPKARICAALRDAIAAGK